VSYPKTNKAVREAALAYSPNIEEAREAYEAAIGIQSIAALSVGVFDALKDQADALDAEGRKVLTGVASLIVGGGWYGKTLEAAFVVNTIAPTIPDDLPVDEGL